MIFLPERIPLFEGPNRGPLLHTLRSDGSYLTAASLALDTKGIAPTFARNCVAYRDYWDGATRKLVEVAANVPRWCTRKDSAGNLHSGLLVEPDQTNSIGKSKDLNLWTSSLVNVAKDDVEWVSGAVAAEKITATNSTGYHAIASASLTPPAGALTISGWFKYGNYRYAKLRVHQNSPFAETIGGVIDLQNTEIYSIFTGNTSGIEVYGDGWIRVWFSGTVANQAHTCDIVLCDGADAQTLTGDEFIYCTGTQVNTGIGFPSSAIDTEAAPATKLADAISYNIAGRIGQRGSLVFDVMFPAQDIIADVVPISLHDGTANNRITCSILAAGDIASATVVSGGDTQADITDATTDVCDGDKHTIAISWEPNSVKLYVDGTLEGTADTSATIPSGITTLTLGDNDGANQPNAMISDLKIYNRPGVTS
jgi:hypothetical protein